MALSNDERREALRHREPKAADLVRFLAARIAAVANPRLATPEILQVRSVCPGVAVAETTSFPVIVCLTESAELDPLLLAAARQAGLCGFMWEYLQSMSGKPRLERNWQPSVVDPASDTVLAARAERVTSDRTGASRLFEVWVEAVEPAASALALASPAFAQACRVSPRLAWAASDTNRQAPPSCPFHNPLHRVPYMPALLELVPPLAEPALGSGRSRLSALAV
jgi:hypothetical protein